MPRCEACGADLVFALNVATSKKVPIVLNPKAEVVEANRAHCYLVGGEECRKATAEDIDAYLEFEKDPLTKPFLQLGVSHFRTCTDPTRFNRGKK